MAAPNSIRMFLQIKDHVSQCGQILAGIHSPAQLYQNHVEAIHTKLNGAWSRIFLTTDMSQRAYLQAMIQDSSRELERFENIYNATLKEAQAAYEHQLDLVVVDCCRKLSESVDAVLRNSERSPAPEPGPGDLLESAPSEPEEGQQTNKEQVDDDTRKRKRAEEAVDQPKRTKTGKSITFEEVYQDGKAPFKHTIVQWPPGEGKWYILRCDEHGHIFTTNPLFGAAAHIRGKKHGSVTSDFKAAVELFGIEVLDCNEELSMKNNDIIPSAKSYKIPYEQLKSPAAKNNTDGVEGSQHEERGSEVSAGANERTLLRRKCHQREHHSPQPVIDPVGGQVYRTFWNMSKQWLAALLLPMEKLENVGVPETIESLGLLESLPECYMYNSEDKTFSWRDGYEDDGPQESKRQFPVMFFDGTLFPSKSSVAWIGAQDLQLYDPSASELIEYNQQVLDYLKDRKGVASRQSRDPTSPVHPTLMENDGVEIDHDSGTSTTSALSDPPTSEDSPIFEEAFEEAFEELPEETPAEALAEPRVEDLEELPPSEISKNAPMEALHEAPVEVLLEAFEHYNEGKSSTDAPNAKDGPSLPPENPDAPLHNHDTRVEGPLFSDKPHNGEEPTTSITSPVQEHQTVPQRTDASSTLQDQENAAQIAQMAWGIVHELAIPAAADPAIQSQDTSPLRRQQDPMTSPGTEQATSAPIEQPARSEDVVLIDLTIDSQTVNPAPPAPPAPMPPNFGPQRQMPWTQLPPIRTLEEHAPPNGQGYHSWVNGTPGPWMDRSQHRAPLPPQPAQPQTPSQVSQPTSPTATWRSNAQNGTVSAKSKAWLTNFPPLIVDELRKVTRGIGRDPIPEDFMTSRRGSFQCPFCPKMEARLTVFTQHIEKKCMHIKWAMSRRVPDIVPTPK